jgi:hypothetical protein
MRANLRRYPRLLQLRRSAEVASPPDATYAHPPHLKYSLKDHSHTPITFQHSSGATPATISALNQPQPTINPQQPHTPLAFSNHHAVRQAPPPSLSGQGYCKRTTAGRLSRPCRGRSAVDSPPALQQLKPVVPSTQELPPTVHQSSNPPLQIGGTTHIHQGPQPHECPLTATSINPCFQDPISHKKTRTDQTLTKDYETTHEIPPARSRTTRNVQLYFFP